MKNLNEVLIILNQVEAIENNRPMLARTNTTIINDQQAEHLFKTSQKIIKNLIGRDITKLTTKSLNKIRLVFQKIIQDAYITGKEYNALKLGHSAVLTTNDLREIQAITKKIMLRFFNIVKKPRIVRESYSDLLFFVNLDELDFDELDVDDVDDLILDFPELEDSLDMELLDGLYDEFLVDGDYESANIITRMKAFPHLMELSSYQSGNVLKLILAGPDGFSKTLEIPMSKLNTLAKDATIEPLNKGTLSNSSSIVQFVTKRDEKVCPICEDLDMEQFSVDPITHIIDGPVIPDDVHFGCRCRYLSLDEDEELLVG